MSKALLKSLFCAAIAAVDGRLAVKQAAKTLTDFKPERILAVGKAANNMLLGAFDSFGETPALCVSKKGHIDDIIENHSLVEVIEAGHPIPDEASLLAGKRLSEYVENCHGPLLMLVSGGASALAESLTENMTLLQWQVGNQALIASGQPIEQINIWRKQHSHIKGGKLLSRYKGARLVVMAISDVQGDDLSVIGSGLANIEKVSGLAQAFMVGTNHIARIAAESAAMAQGYPVIVNQESLYKDVFELAPQIVAKLLEGKPGVYIFGGEPTIKLPKNPGLGGRNQSLALAIAALIQGRRDIVVLVAGTDGSDGPTDAAGAIVDGATYKRIDGAKNALEKANAGEYLRLTKDILTTGPTGTNVMDLVIAQKLS